MGSGSRQRSISDAQVPASADAGKRLLTKREFQSLSDVPTLFEWYANLKNGNTKRAYGRDVEAFMQFVGIKEPEDFRLVKRMLVIVWRDALAAQKLSVATIRQKLSAVSELFDYLSDRNSVSENPVTGVERPKEGANEGKTPALSGPSSPSLVVNALRWPC